MGKLLQFWQIRYFADTMKAPALYLDEESALQEMFNNDEAGSLFVKQHGSWRMNPVLIKFEGVVMPFEEIEDLMDDELDEDALWEDEDEDVYWGEV